jgi:SH3-like domain-containing protein
MQRHWQRYVRCMTKFPSLALAISLLGAIPAQAQNMQVPYWAALREDKVNMRVGPAEDYKIGWVYSRKQLPVKVLRIKDGWRLVQDPDGARGWILSRFLTRERSALVRGQGATEMREKGEANARLLWRLQPGVVGKLGDCAAGWCRLEIGARAGFVRQDRLWGAGAP